MTDCLVFSKDRPLQLDGLLSSIRRHAPRLYASVTVLAAWSDARYRAAYASIDADIRPQACFEEDVHGWLDRAGGQVCFLCDDDLFYRAAPRVELRESEACFTLRLGGRRTSRWRFADYPLTDDRGYPLALDGHILRRQTIVGLLDFSFTDPNRLEAQLAGRTHRLREPLMAGRSCLVGIPANRVSSSSICDHMGVDPRMLLDLYLDGWRLDPDRMDFIGVRDGHANIAYAYRRP